METKEKTHEVFNQYTELFDYNLFDTDSVLSEYFQQKEANWAKKTLQTLGATLGTANMFKDAQLANEYTPVLMQFDNRGNRIDEVEFYPTWHVFMSLCKTTGLISSPFTSLKEYRWSYMAANFMLQTQVEAGAMCPATMTLASIPILMKEETLWTQIKDKLFSNEYDPRDVPINEKKSIWIGMGMTEKQGGSDVRSNTTIAKPIDKSGRGEWYSLTGHKWFMSTPMCDAHIIIAKISETNEFCSFFVPRWNFDNTKNNVHIQRLKNKLGNKSNASAEVEFCGARGMLIGDAGRGIPTIMEMANHTRLCCVLGSSGLMRQATIQTIAYSRKRKTFGKTLYEHPLMRKVLVDFALETEATQVLALKLAESFENDNHNNISARAWKRLITPVAKYWICKRAETLTAEAIEVFGGNGYVEDSHLVRIFREAPVNSIWEGSGNIMCLDVLRVFQKEPNLGKIIMDELYELCCTLNDDAVMKSEWLRLNYLLSLKGEELESCARLITEKLAIIAQVGLLSKRSPKFVTDAFIAVRCSGRSDNSVPAQFGAFKANDINVDAILERALPIKH